MSSTPLNWLLKYVRAQQAGARGGAATEGLAAIRTSDLRIWGGYLLRRSGAGAWEWRDIGDIVVDLTTALRSMQDTPFAPGHGGAALSLEDYRLLDLWTGLSVHRKSDEEVLATFPTGSPISKNDTVRRRRARAIGRLGSALPPRPLVGDLPTSVMPQAAPDIELVLARLGRPTNGLKSVVAAWQRRGIDDQAVLRHAVVLACQLRFAGRERESDIFTSWLHRNRDLLGRLDNEALERPVRKAGSGGMRKDEVRICEVAFAICAAQVARGASRGLQEFSDVAAQFPGVAAALLAGVAVPGVPANVAAETPSGFEEFGHLLAGDGSEEALFGAAAALNEMTEAVSGLAARLTLERLGSSPTNSPATRALLKSAASAARQARSADVYGATMLLAGVGGESIELAEAGNEVILGAQRREQYGLLHESYRQLNADLSKWALPQIVISERLEQAELAMAGTYTILAESVLTSLGGVPNRAAPEIATLCHKARRHADEASRIVAELPTLTSTWGIETRSGPTWRFMPLIMSARAYAIEALSEVWVSGTRSPRAATCVNQATLQLNDVLSDPRLTKRQRWEALNAEVIVLLALGDEKRLVEAVLLLAAIGGDRREVGGRHLAWLADFHLSNVLRPDQSNHKRRAKAAFVALEPLPLGAPEPRLPDLGSVRAAALRPKR